ncbi:beta-N-acetylhexosaminidase [Pseudoroseomonas wenyumeiae]|uniref:beta-N-acetylhexosaminidase n=1 Tax=Teichococcus wenyumeiae TaxID=2478470 RepID=A0A3A9JU25_9PROT|nr:beta-N-acetylhexosaminidase [Pseudoroseomonas wenyumeiae]RKK04248.1 beta-N-acetylhexosaminidase [Pseudoroseomonas wenyumeiae]RMI19174.1 beta-N-acetylhexosaminidase [Pseudoroseomonas wenyumeiae]
MAPARAVIIGLSGPALLAEEAALLRRFRPAGAILFARNVQTPAQLLALTDAIREELGEAAPILVDQEGGRVARLRPPHWPAFPPPGSFENRSPAAAEANATLLAMECVAAGLDVVCSPVLDLRLPGAHGVIGDRGFSAKPAEVIRLAEAWVRGLQSGGAIPVLKHMPGHGRAMVDSHLELPRVSAGHAALTADFAPFTALARSGAWAMTAHLLYDALDPEKPATLSRRIISGIIRQEIGFDGVLVSDDLDMKALSGSPGELVSAALAAGCDLALQCSGVLADTAATLEAASPLTELAEARMAAARAARDAASNGVFPDPIALAARRDALLRDVA